MAEYDTLIIGAGQAGIPLARFVAQQGIRVALAERRFLGGSCVNFGCTPTKAVLASARVARLARRASEFGLRIPTIEVDYPAVLRRAQKMVDDSRAGLRRGLDEKGVKILNGHARLAGREGDHFRLTVGERTIIARRVVIDTGTRTAIPDIAGLADVPYLHAGNWLSSDHCPKRLAIIGASYIGLEMAQFYRAMGAEVCVIGPSRQIARREDEDVAAELQRLMEAEGITFHLSTRVTAVARDASGTLSLTTDTGRTITATDLFLATGRRPNTDDLGLDTVGVERDAKGFIKVDQRLASNVPGIWAAGDVRGGPMFTHSSWDDHRILENQFFADGQHTTAGRIVPYAIFTDPELGRVGLTEREARDQYGDSIRVQKFKLRHNGKAVQTGEPNGFIKVIADPDDRLLGAAVLAADGAELVASYITLMNSGATLAAICNGIYIHPTMAEAVQ
ncbi:MAG: FAD-dependent pyridine nucleotide-disulfide oxidoreductase, partial [Phycisphaerales bacterium]|nr:FAD-dependent pyridine nucleotide-disulfide oxidoreductase [Phycisphaerales bacterium]